MGLFKKGSWAWSMFNMKCPRCRQGDLFETPTFSFQKPFDMPKRCSCCGQHYMPAPGFYYGAMFLSYIFWGWTILIIALFFVFALGWSVGGGMAVVIAVSAIFFVWVFRISRSLWIHFMVKYDEEKAQIMELLRD